MLIGIVFLSEDLEKSYGRGVVIEKQGIKLLRPKNWLLSWLLSRVLIISQHENGPLTLSSKQCPCTDVYVRRYVSLSICFGLARKDDNGLTVAEDILRASYVDITHLQTCLVASN